MCVWAISDDGKSYLEHWPDIDLDFPPTHTSLTSNQTNKINCSHVPRRGNTKNHSRSSTLNYITSHFFLLFILLWCYLLRESSWRRCYQQNLHTANVTIHHPGGTNIFYSLLFFCVFVTQTTFPKRFLVCHVIKIQIIILSSFI